MKSDRCLGLLNSATNPVTAITPPVGSMVIAVAAKPDHIVFSYWAVAGLAALCILIGTIAVLVRIRAADNQGFAKATSPRPQPARIWSLLRLGWTKRGRAFGVLSVWVLVEHLTARLQRIRPVRSQAMLRYALMRYRGERVVLHDGTVVATGDPIIELHFDNHRLLELTKSGTSPWPLLRQARSDLTALEKLLASGSLGDIKALHGLTLFAPAGSRLGFEARPLPRTWRFALERFFMTGLVVLYHPAGWTAAAHQAARWPGEVWMSRAILAHRYRIEGSSASEQSIRESAP